MTTRKDIEQVLWNACDSFRGKIDSSRYKDYILSMLFVKYLSDVSKERREGISNSMTGICAGGTGHEPGNALQWTNSPPSTISMPTGTMLK